MSKQETGAPAPSEQAVIEAAEAAGWTVTYQGLGYGFRKGRRTAWMQVRITGGFVRGSVSRSDGSGNYYGRAADMAAAFAGRRVPR